MTYPEGIAASRTVLRGYDWLTVVAGELARWLGGVDALRASGAFARVEPPRPGGVWLLATEDYAGERVEAVWRALAPVLRSIAELWQDEDWREYILAGGTGTVLDQWRLIGAEGPMRSP